MVEAKRDGKDLFSSIVNGLEDAVLATDRHGRIVSVNPAAERLMGLRGQDLIGKSLRGSIRVRQADTGAEVALPTPRFFQKNRRPRHLSHLMLVPPSGDEKLVDVVITPMSGYRGAIDGTVLVLRDVGDTVLAARAAMDQEKIQAIGTMAGSMAREFSDSLGTIAGHASSVADGVIPLTRPHKEALRILEASDHAGGLVKRLMSIARSSNSQGDPEMLDISLGEVVANAIELVRRSLELRGIIFKVRDIEGMPYVVANENQLLDCLIALFSNAATAMPDGGTITIDVSEKQGTNDAGAFVVLRIRDTGCGMTKEIIRQIFDPFFSTKHRDVAIGLGLSVVKSSVEGWGGSVKVRSHPGHGTSFRLLIPKADTQPTKERGRAHAGGETILVVDDDRDTLADATKILRKAGYSVHVADGGERGLKLYERHADKIALSIVDVIMPGMDGKGVLEGILATDPTAAIIMTSGFSREYVRGYLERGAWEFMQKPLDHDLCLGIVRRLLDKRVAWRSKGAG